MDLKLFSQNQTADQSLAASRRRRTSSDRCCQTGSCYRNSTTH